MTFVTHVRLLVIRYMFPGRLKAEKDRVCILNGCRRLQSTIEVIQFKWMTYINQHKQLQMEYKELLDQVKLAIHQRTQEQRELAAKQGVKFVYSEQQVMEWLNYEETRMMSALKLIKMRIQGVRKKCAKLKSLTDMLEMNLIDMDKTLMDQENAMMIGDVTQSLESIKGVDIVRIGENITASLENTVSKAAELNELLQDVRTQLDETDNKLQVDMDAATKQQTAASALLNKELMLELFAEAIPQVPAKTPIPEAQVQPYVTPSSRYTSRAIPTATPADEAEGEEDDLLESGYYPPRHHARAPPDPIPAYYDHYQAPPPARQHHQHAPSQRRAYS